MQAVEGCRLGINLIDFIQSQSTYLERVTDKLTDIQYFPLFDPAQPYLKKTPDHKHLLVDSLPNLCGALRESTRLMPLACDATDPGRVEAAGRAVDEVLES